VKYRHSFHAGNFADVHKHVALLALLRALQRKDKGFLYLETHAGRGVYDLDSADTRRSGELKQGFNLLRNSLHACAEIADYQQCMSQLRTTLAPLNAYPGSPLIAASVLRAQDRGVAYESQPAECRALERALHRHRNAKAHCGDGWGACAAQLPPPERRALVLIDPPFEESHNDFTQLLNSATVALTRLANAVIAIWYPIKDDRELLPWLTQVAARIAAPVLASELWLYPRDSNVALNGSGLLIVNPPYQQDVRMEQWLPALAGALGADKTGGQQQKWIVPEAPV
jgi:23S rRNA (adenine2030-N6)-methyltransferase